MSQNPNPHESKSQDRAKTDYLQMPQASPAVDRDTDGDTGLLTPKWSVVLKIEDKATLPLPIRDQMIIGRTIDDTIVDLDLGPYGGYQGGVSRLHARLRLRSGILYIEDLSSTNGTRINGFQLRPNEVYRLRDGDELEFARVRAIIRFQRP